MFEGYSFNRPQTSIGYPIDIDGIGRLDYVSFIRSPYRSSISTVYAYTVLGRDKPVDIVELKKIAEVKANRLAEEEAARIAVIRAADELVEKELAAFEAELAAELAE